MPFSDTETKKTTYDKPVFLDLTPGLHTIRILETNIEPIFVHGFILGKYTLKCLGDTCPICADNHRIYMENPDGYRDVKGYSPKSKKYIFNVLDKTPVKVCSNCGAENPKTTNTFPSACTECGTIIINEKPKPANKVKLLSCGVKLATAINSIDKTVNTEEGEPIGFTNYDIKLSVEGTGKLRNIIPIPTDNMEKFDVPTDALQDPSKGVIALESDEIIELLKGVQLKDIFRARGKTDSKEDDDDAIVNSLLG
jgi:DNA-directed RNA polymerase subunit RPC12/RpoP